MSCLEGSSELGFSEPIYICFWPWLGHTWPEQAYKKLYIAYSAALYLFSHKKWIFNALQCMSCLDGSSKVCFSESIYICFWPCLCHTWLEQAYKKLCMVHNFCCFAPCFCYILLYNSFYINLNGTKCVQYHKYCSMASKYMLLSHVIVILFTVTWNIMLQSIIFSGEK
jgi:hypothetical protein